MWLYVENQLRRLRVELGPRDAELDAADGARLDDEWQLERRLHGARLDLEVLKEHVPVREAGWWGIVSRVWLFGRVRWGTSCSLARMGGSRGGACGAAPSEHVDHHLVHIFQILTEQVLHQPCCSHARHGASSSLGGPRRLCLVPMAARWSASKQGVSSPFFLRTAFFMDSDFTLQLPA